MSAPHIVTLPALPRARGRAADSTAPSAPVSLEGVSALLAGLNPEQRRAVTHGDGPLLVVAGPGTGKTHVITRRIAWLIATKRARPSEILALTFTDKAADEMQSRVDVLVPYGFVDTAIHTFHAFGDRLIREHAFELGLPREPLVLSRAEAIGYVRERLFEFALEEFRPLGDPTRFIGALVGLFNRAKDEDVSPSAYFEFVASLEHVAAAARSEATDDESRAAADALEREARRQREIAGAYGRYQELLGASGRIDFGDQVALAVRLLREHPDVRARVQRRYRYVLVDEFQDTNPAQLELLQLLCAPQPNITAVGDDDQSIYTFRGAALGALLGFDARFGSATRVVLRRNYRSRTPVLDAAYRLIRHNDPYRLEAQLGLDKRLRAHRRGAAVGLEARAFGTVADEADWVAETIADRIRRGAAPREFAILARTNADTEPFLRSLNMRGIPWTAGTGSGLYARAEVRPLLSFLRAVADPNSTVDLYGVATAEPYRLGGEDLAVLLEYGRRKRRSLWSVLGELQSQPGIVRVSDGTRKVVARLHNDMRAALELADQRPAGEVLYGHLKRTGRLAALAGATTPDAEERLADLARFFAVVRDQGNVLEDDRVPFVVEQLRTLIESGDDGGAPSTDENVDAVSVLTVHKAKGLEFRVVFLVGLADGTFPGRGRRESLVLPEALYRRDVPIAEEVPFAEERRLCYVAMTRARDELFLSYAVDAGGRRARRPSPFLSEALDRPAPRIDARPPRIPALEPDTRVPAARRSRRQEPLNLSFSQLDDYLTCPLRYRLRHVVGVPVPPHHSLGYGSALHQAVAAYHVRQQKGAPMSLPELLDVFKLHWSGDGFISRAHEEARFAAGRDVLRRFHAANATAAPPVGVEQEFTFQVDADRIRGRIDRVDETSDGVVITDYKSSDVRDPAKARQRARESLQLAIYALAHEARTGVRPAAVQLHFLDSGVVGCVPVEPARLEAATEKIRTAAAGIRDGAFEPAPDYVACGYCPFRDICPASAA